MRYDLAKLNKFELYLFIAFVYLVKFGCCGLSRLRLIPAQRRASLLRWGRLPDEQMKAQP